ncbi:MAG TPA: oxidoreductase, partial [Xanthomonadales bacterium]|nr:oxidoreductase [Xanthomonadales bacterium]
GGRRWLAEGLPASSATTASTALWAASWAVGASVV